MVYGVGIDLVDIQRIRKIIQRWDASFLEKIFSADEVAYCKKHAQSAVHFGARFAAKESFLKALGMGLGDGIRLAEIEVVNDKTGKPALKLRGAAREHLRKRKIQKVHLSLTHTRECAAAVVVLERK
jgi:holo-[acyl-carrier protein] synthase